MPIFRGQGLNILFVHVPKTGGTSIERLFARSGFDVIDRDGVTGRDSTNWLRRISPQHLHADLLRQTVHVNRFDLVFMTVREPLARYRSEYLMRNKEDPRTDAASVDAWTERVLTNWRTNPSVWDNHIRPQRDFLLEEARIFKLEDSLEALVGALSDEHGLQLLDQIPHAHRQRSGIPSSAVELSAATEARLREHYAVDFETFGY